MKIVSPGILRDARTGKLLKTLMYENHVLRQMDNVRPTHPIFEKKPYKPPDGGNDDVAEKTLPKKSSRR